MAKAEFSREEVLNACWEYEIDRTKRIEWDQHELIKAKMKPRLFGLLPARTYEEIERELIGDIWSEWHMISIRGSAGAHRVKNIKALCQKSSSSTIELSSEDIYVLKDYM